MKKLNKPSGYSCWCGTDNYAIVFTVGTYSLYHCPNCGTFRNNPPPISDDSAAAAFYSEYYQDGHAKPQMRETVRKSRFWKVFNRVPKSLWEQRRKVIDVGCGSGDLIAELGEMGWSDPIGCDISKSRISNAKKTYPEYTFFDCGISELIPENLNRDLVILDNVVEHIPDPKGFLAELGELLVKDGALVVITPNMRSGNFRLLGKQWTPELCPHTHIFLFTENSLAKLAEDAGYKVQYRGNFFVGHDWRKAYGSRLKSGDLKGLIWRMMQDLGSLYGRLISNGEMIYIVATK